ncbi:MAG: hypothetical protein WD335_03960 [Candidatus Paceibacterota bacterium]
MKEPDHEFFNFHQRWILYITCSTINILLAIPIWKMIIQDSYPITYFSNILMYPNIILVIMLFFTPTFYVQSGKESFPAVLLGVIGAVVLPMLYVKFIISMTSLLIVAMIAVIIVLLIRYDKNIALVDSNEEIIEE